MHGCGAGLCLQTSASGHLVKTIAALAVAFIVISCRPSRDDYYTNGEKYLQSGQFSEASIEFRNALKADRNHVQSHFGLARSFQRMMG